MGKQELKTKQTQVRTSDADGHQLEQTYTVDDGALPSPIELEAYKAIDPGIVKFLLETSVKEQNHRHLMDIHKVKIIRKESHKIHSINWWGMFFAFLVMICGIGLSAYLIYCGKDIIGTIFGGITLISAASLFIRENSGNKQNTK